MDRNFINGNVFYRLTHTAEGARRSRDWMTRAKSSSKWKTIKELGPDDELVELTFSSEARKKNLSLPKTMRYQIKGFRPSILLTSLTDAQAYPAAAIISLYHQRWETELGYDELKTDLLERKESLRSRTPTGVGQELWGLLLT